MTCTLKTADLFAVTHRALLSQQWGQARVLLDALDLRSDNRDKLCSAESYGCPAFIRSVIQDRIDLVNSKVDR
jgi:hypothetical protein